MSKKAIVKRVAKRNNKVKAETNDQAHKKAITNKGGQHDCRYCPPFKGDNQVTPPKAKHSKTKPKYKNKRG